MLKHALTTSGPDIQATLKFSATMAAADGRAVSHPMDTTFVNPADETDWDKLVLSHPDATFFHSAAWAKVLSRTYGHKPVYLRCSRGGEPLALIPMMDVRSPLTGCRGVCLPFTDFCGPLMFGETDLAQVMDKLRDLARERKWKYLEIRDGKTLGSSAASGVSFYGHTLDLRGDTEALFKRLKGSARTAVRKAQRSGLSVQVSWAREAILQYYRLHTSTRRRHGLPPQPMSFFMNIYDEVIKPRLGFVVMVNHGSRPVAAGVFFVYGKRAVYKFSASDERFREFQGNNLMLWEGIQFLALNGAESLHLGRTSLENDGLRRYKLSWGTQEETIAYLKFDVAAGAWVSGGDAVSGSDNAILSGRDAVSGFHNAIFRKMPLAVNRLAGSIIYPHLD